MANFFFRVVFNTNGGSEIVYQSVIYLRTAFRPAPPIRDGHDFIDWYTDNTFTIRFNFSTPIIGDIILHARWTIHQVTLTFDSAGGQTLFPVTQDWGTLFSLPPQPSRDRYVFTGWTVDDEFVDFPLRLTSDTTVVAQWMVLIQSFTIFYGFWDPVVYNPNEQRWWYYRPRVDFNEIARRFTCGDLNHTTCCNYCPNCRGAGWYWISCSACNGTGRGSQCTICNGTGRITCPTCGGRGSTGGWTDEWGNTTPARPCATCNGSGNIACIPCSGRGFFPCTTCSGSGQVRRNCDRRYQASDPTGGVWTPGMGGAGFPFSSCRHIRPPLTLKNMELRSRSWNRLTIDTHHAFGYTVFLSPQRVVLIMDTGEPREQLYPGHPDKVKTGTTVLNGIEYTIFCFMESFTAEADWPYPYPNDWIWRPRPVRMFLEFDVFID